jgi:hypothetical protein
MTPLCYLGTPRQYQVVSISPGDLVSRRYQGKRFSFSFACSTDVNTCQTKASFPSFYPGQHRVLDRPTTNDIFPSHGHTNNLSNSQLDKREPWDLGEESR